MNLLDLDDAFVFQASASADDIRAFEDEDDLPDEVMAALDSAQSAVYLGQSTVAYVLLKITQ